MFPLKRAPPTAASPQASRDQGEEEPPTGGKLCDIEAHNISIEIKDAFEFAGQTLSTLASDPDFVNHNSSRSASPRRVLAAPSGNPDSSLR